MAHASPYSPLMLEHCRRPRNVGTLPVEARDVGTARVDAPWCQDVVRLQIRVDPDTTLIAEARFKTFGCGPAIASSSLATEWLQGRSLDGALAISSARLAADLTLPARRTKCATTVETAIRLAVEDYKRKQGTDDHDRDQ
jgi:nitrogen fixation NifU-like protein